MQQHHVACFDLDPIVLEHTHQLIVAHREVLPAEVGVQIDHHPPALNTMAGHVLDPQRAGTRSRPGRAGRGDPRILRIARTKDMEPPLIAVVVDRLGQSVAIGIEHLARMRKAVPLGRILQVHDHQVIADNVGLVRVVIHQTIIHIRTIISNSRTNYRWMASWI